MHIQSLIVLVVFFLSFDKLKLVCSIRNAKENDMQRVQTIWLLLLLLLLLLLMPNIKYVSALSFKCGAWKALCTHCEFTVKIMHTIALEREPFNELNHNGVAMNFQLSCATHRCAHTVCTPFHSTFHFIHNLHISTPIYICVIYTRSIDGSIISTNTWRHI